LVENYNFARVKIKITTLLFYISICQNIWKVISSYYINVIITLRNICNLKNKIVLFVKNNIKLQKLFLYTKTLKLTGFVLQIILKGDEILSIENLSYKYILI
jgi:hypothetical protein